MDEGKNKRGSYPIQTSAFAPQPELESSGHDEPQTKQPFPRTIRALKDANSTDFHGRTVVICLDGTGDRFDGDNSNVVRFVACLRKHSPAEQVTYYQSGIGTYGKGGLKGGLGAAMDMAVGSGLGIHIKDAYRFLMQTYREGDKICLLGFSRGAYTVRCLAGMLHKVGLLPASNVAQINFAFAYYKDDTPQGWKMSAQFKHTFCTDVNVYFVGLWDCVASVGFLPRKLPFSKSPTNSINYFRHAMALDERRAKFAVCQWQQQDPDLKTIATPNHNTKAQIKKGVDRTEVLKVVGQSPPKTVPLQMNGHHSSSADLSEKDLEQASYQSFFEKYDRSRRARHRVQTDILEVWFKGAHADIGGGAVANEERHMLSRIPFRWMVRQCFECNTGISFGTAALAEMGIDVASLWPVCKPPHKPPFGPSPDLISRYERKDFPPLRRRSAFVPLEEGGDEDDHKCINKGHKWYGYLPECIEDYFDALGPANDQLAIAKSWWILELWPVKVRILAEDGDCWEKKVRWNLGRHRAVRENTPKMHWTVKALEEEGKYSMKARCEKGAHWEIVC